MLKAFLEVASALDFSPMQAGYGAMPGGADVRLLYAAWTGTRCELGLRLWRAGMAPPERWTVTCEIVDDYRLLAAPCSELRLADQHVLLERYTAPAARLSFRGQPPSVPDAVGALAEAHWRHAGDWLSLDTFLNPQVEVAELLAAGIGVLAEGPRPLLEAYSVALRRHGVDASVIASETTSRRASTSPPRRALLLTPSYIVGAGFEAELHHSELPNRQSPDDQNLTKGF
jgi:hypothetical protein